MVKIKKEEKEIKEEVKEEVRDRKSIIREALLKVMKDKKLYKGGVFEEEKCFDMRKVVDLPGTRGLLRDALSDFKPEEKRTFRAILQELKTEGVLFHKTGAQWAWRRTG